MYAIVDIAGQQFKVEAGKQIIVNRQAAEVGSSVSYDKVLLLAGDEGGVKVGNPYVEGAAVNATVVEHCKADKVIIFKKKRRKGYQKKNGHRQYLTKIQIEGIA